MVWRVLQEDDVFAAVVVFPAFFATWSINLNFSNLHCLQAVYPWATRQPCLTMGANLIRHMAKVIYISGHFKKHFQLFIEISPAIKLMRDYIIYNMYKYVFLVAVYRAVISILIKYFEISVQTICW